MRLLTHNLLQCNIKTCMDNKYPLELIVEEAEDVDTVYNRMFLERIVPKIDWNGLERTLKSLQYPQVEAPTFLDCKNMKEMPEDWWESVHTLLLSKNIMTGRMICRGCGYTFEIVDGIPNMLTGSSAFAIPQ